MFCTSQPRCRAHLRRALPSHIARGPHYTRLCGSSDTANASPLAPAAVSLATSLNYSALNSGHRLLNSGLGSTQSPTT